MCLYSVKGQVKWALEANENCRLSRKTSINRRKIFEMVLVKCLDMAGLDVENKNV